VAPRNEPAEPIYLSVLPENTNLMRYLCALGRRTVLIESPYSRASVAVTYDTQKWRPPGPATYPNRAKLNRRLARQSDGRRPRFGNRQRSHQDRVIVLDSNLLACGAHLTDPAKTEVGDSRKNDGRSVSGLSKRPSRLRDSVSYSLRSNGGREHTSPPVI
jgi:hypothetical protein